MQVNVPEKLYKTTPWWHLLLEGIIAAIVGFFLLTAPTMTVELLIQLLGLFWLVSGILSIVGIFVTDSDLHWAWSLLIGIVGILAGLVVLRHPLWSTVLVPSMIVIFLGVLGLVKGGVEFYRAFKGGGLNSVLMGVVSLLFGILLLSNTLISLRVLVVSAGILGLIGGLAMVVYAFSVRNG